MDALHPVALVTALSSIMLLLTAMNVARMRGKHRIQAPLTTGHPEFDRAFRIQMNTLENTVVFLPMLWLFAVYVNPIWAAGVGGIWLAGRLWYAIGYQLSANKRGGGFVVSFLAYVVMASGAMAGILRELF
jgi:uncharacterized membrane protein YecN with MAPEG domain